MFKKLKRKFILTSVLTSAAVLIITFSTVYLIALNATYRRDIVPAERQKFIPTEQNVDLMLNPQITNSFEQQLQDQADNFNSEMKNRIEAERQASLQTLLVTLIATGIAMEIIVLIISLFLAEQAIKPVREAYNAQKDFIANASHEIKTPLAVIQANLEAADIKGNKWLDNVAKKTEDLANLNNQLLALARSESIDSDVKLRNINLNRLVDEAISAFEPKATKKKLSITKHSSLKDVDKSKINAEAFTQILNIYIDNAIKYSKKKIIINIEKNSVKVISDGKPMAKDKIPHLFDRFYQSDKSSEGVGLGLAIAQSVASKNGWELRAYVDEKTKRNVFILQLK